jgi:hypothetical protein
MSYLKIGTLSVHVSAHGDCIVAIEFNQYSVACKNTKKLTFKTLSGSTLYLMSKIVWH